MRACVAALVLLAGCGRRAEAVIPTPERLAFTVNASYDHVSGSYSIVDLETGGVAADVSVISPDAVGVCAGGMLVILERLGWDTLTVVDRESPFGIVAQHSLGAGTNPQGLAVLPGGQVLVTLLGADHVPVIDLATGGEVARIDVGWAADADGLPEASLVCAAGDLVAVAMQRLDRDSPLWDPTGPGWLVLVDAASLEIVDADPATADPDALVLTGANPSPYGRMIPLGGKLLVPESGFYGVLDGGLDVVDLVEMRAGGFVVTEAALGGDITDVVVVDERIAYATVAGIDGRDRLVGFDPSDGSVGGAVLEGEGFTLLQMADSGGRILVVDRSLSSAGLAVVEGGEVTGRIVVGMAPFSVCVP